MALFLLLDTRNVTVSFTNNAIGTVHLIADTSGHYVGGVPSAPSAFSARGRFLGAT